MRSSSVSLTILVFLANVGCTSGDPYGDDDDPIEPAGTTPMGRIVLRARAGDILVAGPPLRVVEYICNSPFVGDAVPDAFGHAALVLDRDISGSQVTLRILEAWGPAQFTAGDAIYGQPSRTCTLRLDYNRRGQVFRATCDRSFPGDSDVWFAERRNDGTRGRLALLRARGLSSEQRLGVAQYAERSLVGIPYSVALFNYCSALVWRAFWASASVDVTPVCDVRRWGDPQTGAGSTIVGGTPPGERTACSRRRIVCPQALYDSSEMQVRAEVGL